MPALALLLLLAAPSVRSQGKDFTPGDLAMLPEVCTARLRGDDATKKIWSQRVGALNFLHIHHYCFGLYYTNKSQFALKKAERIGYLRSAAKEYDYVLYHWPANSPYRPEVEGRMKEIEMILKLSK